MSYTNELLKLISKKYREQETAFNIVFLNNVHLAHKHRQHLFKLNKEMESNLNYQLKKIVKKEVSRDKN